MKKYFVLPALFVLLSAAAAWSQTSKGSMLIGGTAAFSMESVGSEDDVTTISLAPSAAYFVMDRFAVGGQFELLSSFNDEVTVTALGIQPLVRYYFTGSGVVQPFGQAKFNWSTIKVEGFDAEPGIGYGLGAGADFFLNEHVAFEAILGFDSFKLDSSTERSNKFGFTLGVIAFISGDKL
jgi:hypothetical protein